MSSPSKNFTIIYSNRKNAISIEKKILSQKGILQSHFSVIAVNTNTMNFLRQMVLLFKTDKVLMRDSFTITSFLAALFWGRKITLEVNRPYRNMEGSRNRGFQFIRLLWFIPIFSRVQNMVCVTEEIRCSFVGSAFEKKTRYIPNIAAYLGLKPAQVAKRNDNLRMVFVGDLSQPWQGKHEIENILRDLPDALLTYIGPKQCFSPDVTKRILQTGVISRDDEIIDYCSKCHIGLSTLNFSSRKMVEASPLKHGLYVTAGNWIVSGSKDTMLEDIYPVYQLNDKTYANFIKLIEVGDHIHRASCAESSRHKVLKHVAGIKEKYLDIFQ